MRIIPILLILLSTYQVALGHPTLVSQRSAQKETMDSKYKVGQKWSYRARPDEETSYFIIVKIDNDPKLGRILHIAMRGLKIKNPRSPEGVSENVDHMPFAQEAIEKSGVKLLKEKIELPDFEEGYRLWRQAFDAGRAGIYTITLAEAVNAMEAGLNR